MTTPGSGVEEMRRVRHLLIPQIGDSNGGFILLGPRLSGGWENVVSKNVASGIVSSLPVPAWPSQVSKITGAGYNQD